MVVGGKLLKGGKLQDQKLPINSDEQRYAARHSATRR